MGRKEEKKGGRMAERTEGKKGGRELWKTDGQISKYVRVEYNRDTSDASQI